ISNLVPPADNVEFARNIMCHFLSSFFLSLTRVSLLVWTLSLKKFSSIQENTIAILANLYGELSLCCPALFRIFTNELIDTLNDTIKYDVEFIEEEIHQPKRLHHFLVPEQIGSSFSNNVTIE
ncbi:unnamed protein product, partial [Rotaria sp. Silwood2]